MLVIGYVLVHLLAFFLAAKMMFPTFAIHEDYKPVPQTFQLRTSDGLSITAEYHPVSNATHTLLFSHGNGELISQNRWLFRDWNRMGFSVLAYDFRGYGASEGRPSETGVCRDIQAAWDWLTGEAGVPAGRVIVYGRSVGGGPSVWLAAQQPVAGLVLESSFRSAGRVPLGFRFLLIDWFPSQQRIARVNCPVLLMHGKEDRTIGPSHSVGLHKRALQPKKLILVDRANHNNLHQYTDGWYEESMEWIRRQSAGSID